MKSEFLSDLRCPACGGELQLHPTAPNRALVEEGVLVSACGRRYPLIAIIEGEVAILDAAGKEIVRHPASGFLGEMNLLTGQTVFLTAVVTRPLRYIAVDRDALRALLFDVSPIDPPTLAGVCVLLLAIAMLAAYLPARRAARLDAAIALRDE